MLFFLGQFLWASASGRQAMSTFFQLLSTTLPVAKLLQLSPWPARSYNECFCHHGLVLHTIYFCPRFSNRSSGQQFEGAGHLSHAVTQPASSVLHSYEMKRSPLSWLLGNHPCLAFCLRTDCMVWNEWDQFLKLAEGLLANIRRKTQEKGEPGWPDLCSDKRPALG